MESVENITPPPSDLWKDKLHKYIDEMDEFQARIALSFLENLFGLSD